MSTNEEFLARMLLRINEEVKDEPNYYTVVHPIEGDDLKRLQDIAYPDRTVTIDCKVCGGSGDIECADCEGEGTEEGNNGITVGDCKTCFGSGELRCDDCSGYGCVEVPAKEAR